MQEHLDNLKAALSGRYDIEREIGAGGMATVFLAHDVKHDRQVAVKVLRPDLSASLGAERFLREISIAAKLSHPHILPLYDSGEADGFLYFVMPFIEGESLRARLARTGELPIGEAIRLIRNVVDALALAHKNGIVHRDIKPDNVLLSAEHALVTDFGVAKAVSAATDQRRDLTTSGMAVGTPAYMSPEQAAGDPNIDHRADIYAVGCMAYEMLTGRPPFDSDSAQTILAAHVTDQPDPVQVHRDAIPEGVADVIMRCLEKRPADRWQSAAELRESLDSLTSTGAITPTGARSTSASAELVYHRSQPARVMGMFAVVAVMVLVVTYALLFQLGLPGWVFTAAVAILAVSLPFVMLTGRAERRRASARLSGATRAVKVGGIQDHLTWRRAFTGSTIAFLGLGAVVGVYMGMRLMGIGPVGTLVASGVMEERDRIVLADFVNRTADSALGETITELLRIDLTQSPTVSLLDQSQIMRVLLRMERPMDASLDEALAMDVATREGLKGVVAGEILSVGSGYVVSSSLRTAAGAVLWVGRESASDPSQVIDAVDKLSASLRARIGESLRTIRADPPLAAVTTRSTGALLKYAQADRANNAADYDRAIRLLGEAIDIDSNFAMAYRKLGVILQNQNQEPERRRAALTRGFELRNNLTDRERYLMEAAYYTYVVDSVEASIEAYQSLLDTYPDDHIALNNLAVNYRGQGRMEEAAALYVRAIRMGNAPAVTYTNAIGTLNEVGEADTAVAILDAFAAAYPAHPQLPIFQAGRAAAQFDYEAAARYSQQLLERVRIIPSLAAVANLNLASYAMIQGRPEESLSTLQEAFRIQDEFSLGFINQPWELFGAQVDAVMTLRFFGRREQAVEVLDRARASDTWTATDPANRDYPSLITLYAEAGDVERAQELVRQYRQSVDQTTQETVGARAEMHSARGYIALAEGQPMEALLEFRASRELITVCKICGLVEVGMAYDAAGMADSAIMVYEQYLEDNNLNRNQQDGMNLFRVIRRLGELYDQNGDTDRAIEYYNRFVELWENAEPALQPQVEEIRGRLAELTAR